MSQSVPPRRAPRPPRSPASAASCGSEAEQGPTAAAEVASPPCATSASTADTEPVRWLTHDEELAWRALMRLMAQLPWALECQLQRDAQLSVVEYHALAMLSERDNHTMRMSELAVLTNASLSRLSHLITRLEARGL